MCSGIDSDGGKQAQIYPYTPPPSPNTRQRSQRKLVIISCLIVDPNAPNFYSSYNAVKTTTSVDFNCLDLVFSLESWVVVIDFFSAVSSESKIEAFAMNHKGENAIDKYEGSHNSETNISIRSLSMTLVRTGRDIAKANVSHVDISMKANKLQKEVEGKLGSMSLLDLTLHGQIYKERFMTSGEQALHFNYTRYVPKDVPNCDAHLKLEMSSVFYIHTKRFAAELQAFWYHFEQLQSVMESIRIAASRQKVNIEKKRLSIVLQAGAPVIFLPVHSQSSNILIADLGCLSLTNCFKYSGDLLTISVVNPMEKDKKCLLDVMSLDLQNVDLYSGVITNNVSQKTEESYFKFGAHAVHKVGPSLLTKKCHLKIQIERNLDSELYHNVANMSIHGELSTLDVMLDLNQYQLIKSLLTHNLGENTEHILPSVPATVSIVPETTMQDVWTLSSLKFDLLDVILRLQLKHESDPLARINFIKSRLTIETFSNLSQDVDLVSQEILIMDTRYQESPANKRSNVFTNILQPLNFTSETDIVQAEIHSRKRQDRTKFTILLNNMRLMAVLDWWEVVLKYILEDSKDDGFMQDARLVDDDNHVETGKPIDLKLNITDCEIVVVEDISQWDTNAVILKSTTVISYKPYLVEKPLSCNLNNCEMYSCILGMEDETALSIIDPVTLNLEVNKDRVLEVQLQTLTVRLSYHDMRMFLQILNSLPKQMFKNGAEAPILLPNSKENKIQKLNSIGFEIEDCMKALEHCDGKIDDAALWLTQNAIASATYTTHCQSLSLTAVEVKSDCIFLCIIDDCGDADVPLVELSLGQLNLRQRITYYESSTENTPVEGALECKLSGDYYNRVLSGWEPFVEQWKCVIVWDHILTSRLTKQRLQLNIESQDILNINITSTFMELFRQVHESWMKDFHELISYKRRSPFVPFALKNETGLPLYFTTLIADMDLSFHTEQAMEVTDQWVAVPPGRTVPFTFRLHDKMRHRDSHRLRMHQLGVKVDGFKSVNPVTVDKVGTFFRHTSAETQKLDQDLFYARIVFDVALEGSARKLVTVRSALVLINKLQENVEVKMESSALSNSALSLGVSSKTTLLLSNESLAVPLLHVYSHISVRLADNTQYYSYCNSFNWQQQMKPNECSYELKTCIAPRGAGFYRFCAETKNNNYPGLMRGLQPGHTITFYPSVLLVNLLPIDLNYCLTGASGRITPGKTISISNVDAEQIIELKLCLENFPISGPLIIPASCTTALTCRVRVEDSVGRRLLLQAFIAPYHDARVKISISASYWIINKTGIPLIFKQRGVNTETAGQFEEHEIARMVAPLLFSFSDPDASPSVVARVGTAVVPHGYAQWCQDFDLQRGIKVRRLHIALKDGRPDMMYLIGIEVRSGRGRYRHTNIVTISPRFQIHNKSSYKLLFAQSCFASTVSDPYAETTFVEVVPDCFVPFHWRRLDKDQLLCVIIKNIPDCCWSGSFRIDRNDSMHLNIRDIHLRMYFLRLEVVLQGSTFFVIFTDADTMPPPIRVDNYSEVPINFAQACCKNIQSIARAHTSVPYAWDQSIQPSSLYIVAPGGVSHVYDMNTLGAALGLTYENFIYIAFTETFKNEQDPLDPLDVESQQLVLDVDNNQIILAKKQAGQRSQLWCMTITGQLQHEGSSPPSLPHQGQKENILVLDIEGPAPQPTSYTRLVLRRPDPRRCSTQTWRFTEDGRLCCAHYNMCVQAQDGFFGLRQGCGKTVARWQQWSAAVLGLPQPITHRVTNSGLPLEQAISRQRLRPGSGLLSVEIQTDGPTRVLIIHDMKEKQHYAASDERDWGIISLNQRPNLQKDYSQSDSNRKCTEMQFTLRLAGVGVSLVSRQPTEELIFARCSTIVSEVTLTPTSQCLCLSIKDIQCDNQLLDTPVPVALYVTPPGSRSVDEVQHKLPALEITAEMQPTLNENAVIFKHLIVRLKKLTINLEEKLLLKLCAFFKAGSKSEELLNNTNENDYEAQRFLTEVSAAHAKRYYFGVINLVPDQIRLSMKTANKLTTQLKHIKRKLGFTFIKFEDAAVDLQPFIRQHPFETIKILKHSVVKHFKDELVWQAGIILGSTDFLGNPLGLMNDVSEGVSGLIYEGSVGALVKNVTHGISNSAVKFTESLSDGLGKVTMDDEHEEMRQRIRQTRGRSTDHLVAGIKGFGFGVFSGATGIFKQVYEGATNEGIQGVFSGFGKGLVGVVTKPVVGVLDLASETARAVRDSSRSSNRITPERMRAPRLSVGTGGLLPSYSYKQSQGQQYLYSVNQWNYSEQLVAYEYLRTGSEDLRIIVSSERVRIVTGASGSSLTIVIETHLSDLLQCRPVTLTEGSEIRHYIEITMRVPSVGSTSIYQEPIKRPRIRCDSMDLAHSVSQQLSYAKRLYNDRLHTIMSDSITQGED